MTERSEWQWRIEGKTASGDPYTTSGEAELPSPGEFHTLLEAAMLGSFAQLTGGKAVFGSPGVGCKGPYKVTKIVIECKSVAGEGK
jgi:hypothetical protein